MKKKSLAIITARGGSKRIFKKNIKEFCGKPIIAYSIMAAIESGIFEEVMVSTDDEEIKRVALQYGASVPFMRSESTSGDYASTLDVLEEVILTYKGIGRDFDDFMCIYPTAPFVTPEKIRDAYERFYAEEALSLFTVVPFSFPPQRGLTIADNTLQMIDEKAYSSRSQDLKKIYHDCGQFYVLQTQHFIDTKQLITERTIPYIVSELEMQDIDTIEDWKIAELKYRFMREET